MKLDMANNATKIGEDTTCRTSGNNCPEFRFLFNEDGSNKNKKKAEMLQHIAPVYGEYVDFAATVTFSQQELSGESGYYGLLIQGPGKLTKYSIPYYLQLQRIPVHNFYLFHNRRNGS